MRRIPTHPRGMALVMAMIVVVLVTMLVAGAISFTGTERSASEVQMQQDEMSSCIQAARNLFVAQLRMTMKPIPDPLDPSGVRKTLDIQFDQTFQEPRQPWEIEYTAGPQRPLERELRSGHLGGASIKSAVKVTALEDPLAGVDDLTSKPGLNSPPTFYTVAAVCHQDKDDPKSPEREVEFIVRVGL